MEIINRIHCGGIKVKSIIILLFCVFNACAGVPKYMQRAFYSCFDGKDTGIDSLINIDGYYQDEYHIRRSPTVGGFLKDTLDYYIETKHEHFIFYQNGLCKMYLPAEYDSIRNKYDFSLGLQIVSEKTNKEKMESFYSGYWGYYTICKDTIKTQYIDTPLLLSAIAVREIWYKVIDRNTLIRIKFMGLPQDKSGQRTYERRIKEPCEKSEYPAVFVPAPVIPSPDDAWILKEKWF